MPNLSPTLLDLLYNSEPMVHDVNSAAHLSCSGSNSVYPWENLYIHYGRQPLCRMFFFKHFIECQTKILRKEKTLGKNASLPSMKKHSAKEVLIISESPSLNSMWLVQPNQHPPTWPNLLASDEKLRSVLQAYNSWTPGQDLEFPVNGGRCTKEMATCYHYNLGLIQFHCFFFFAK